MPSIHEELSAQFYRWERRGRGWQVFAHPVTPEPPFLPFGGYTPPTPVDDGRVPTALSSFMRRFSNSLNPPPPQLLAPEPAEEPGAEPLYRDGLVELQLSLPVNCNPSRETFAALLTNLSHCHEPIAFELLATRRRIIAQFAAHVADAAQVSRQLQAFFPEVTVSVCERNLADAWDHSSDCDTLIVEFGLAREFMFSLACPKLDPFIGLCGAFAELQAGELGLFQVIFQPVEQPWAENLRRALTENHRAPIFVNAPELTQAAEEKAVRPLFAAVVRVALRTEDAERTLQLARSVASALRLFGNPLGNELIPLSNEDYPFDEHLEDVVCRQSHRAGMILTGDELLGFVHLPSSAVPVSRDSTKTRPAPSAASKQSGIVFGFNHHAGQELPVYLSPDQRIRHTHIIGASGTGKSTLLYNLIRQDIENGDGLAVLDPHGDLVDHILGCIPRERLSDVILIDPSDEQFSIGFNILSAHSDLEKNLIASDLVSVFQRLSTSWGDQMGSVLQNAILAFLESSRGGTLADLRRFLIEPAFRADFLKTVPDLDLLYYWQKGFPQLTGNKSIGPVLTRLETFLSPKPIRYMVSQPQNRLDFAEIMDSGKILLAKLSQGLLGKENAFLLGTLLVAKFQQLAMSRQAQRAESRRDFWLYLDEFHQFITPSMAEILTGGRKYRIGLTLAHQDLRQLQRDSEVASAVLANPCVRVCFRLGDDDARKLAEGFSGFEARDLQNLELGQAIARIERSDQAFNLTIRPLPDLPDADDRRQQATAASRATYATPRAEMEAALRRAWKNEPPATKPAAPAKPILPPVAETSIPPPTEVKPVEARVTAEAEPAKPPPPPTLSEPTPVTVSEKKPIVPSESKAVEPRDMGRGGAQHQAIQRRIKEAAEKCGFRAQIEQPVLDGAGSVDLMLERAGQVIACEISITTTIDHEVGNVAKCLKAGFGTVSVVCVNEERLRKIGNAVAASLGPEAAQRVQYFLPDDFVAYVQKLPPPAPTEPVVKVSHGYKVKRSVLGFTPEERKQKEESAVRLIAETMRRK